MAGARLSGNRLPVRDGRRTGSILGALLTCQCRGASGPGDIDISLNDRRRGSRRRCRRAVARDFRRHREYAMLAAPVSSSRLLPNNRALSCSSKQQWAAAYPSSRPPREPGGQCDSTGFRYPQRQSATHSLAMEIRIFRSRSAPTRLRGLAMQRPIRHSMSAVLTPRTSSVTRLGSRSAPRLTQGLFRSKDRDNHAWPT